jgi:hypothetical protein
MDYIWLFVAFVVILYLLRRATSALTGLRRRRRFTSRDTLFTPAERNFLGVLDVACADRYRVFGKVRIADLISPADHLDKSEWWTEFNRIAKKHVDFVLCDRRTMQVCAVIELNDRSHNRPDRAARDELVADAFADSGVPLRMVKARRSYSVAAVRKIVDEIGGSIVSDEMRGTPSLTA